jgi:hypothetical protein
LDKGDTLANVNESLDRTQEILPEREPGRVPRQFRTGVAAIPEHHEPTLSMSQELPTGQILTKGHLKQPRPPLKRRLRNLRAGGRLTLLGALVLVVCWTLWAAQSPTGGYANEVLILILIFAVAVGLFGILRLVGGIVLERWMGRTRRSARLAHLGIGLFLAVSGISFLSRVEWLVNAWNSVRGMR